ncbi:MAG: transcriptional regulator [Cryomorphaceae bacterium]|nr:transcriptional regulator [Cryomorphaceae bacterium]
MKDDKKKGVKIVADVLDIIGGKWRGQILARLCDKPMRFNELKADLGRITSSTLTKELRYLEEIKIIERKVISTSPVAVEYSLTEHGSSIKTFMSLVIEWGTKHREVVFRGVV